MHPVRTATGCVLLCGRPLPSAALRGDLPYRRALWCTWESVRGEIESAEATPRVPSHSYRAEVQFGSCQNLSNRKTSGEADFGRSFRVVAGPETVRKPASLASQDVSEASRPPEDAVPFTVVPVMVPTRSLLLLVCGRSVE
jgi:hypothetical protein